MNNFFTIIVIIYIFRYIFSVKLRSINIILLLYENFAIILSAGKSKRFNSEKPKFIHSISGKQLIDFNLEALEKNKNINQINIISSKVNSKFIQNKNKSIFIQNPINGTGGAIKQFSVLIRILTIILFFWLIHRYSIIRSLIIFYLKELNLKLIFLLYLKSKRS